MITEHNLKIYMRDCEGRDTTIELIYRGNENVRFVYEDLNDNTRNCALNITRNILDKFLEMIV